MARIGLTGILVEYDSWQIEPSYQDFWTVRAISSSSSTAGPATRPRCGEYILELSRSRDNDSSTYPRSEIGLSLVLILLDSEVGRRWHLASEAESKQEEKPRPSIAQDRIK
jgi:hypothetical protein